MRLMSERLEAAQQNGFGPMPEACINYDLSVDNEIDPPLMGYDYRSSLEIDSLANPSCLLLLMLELVGTRI